MSSERIAELTEQVVRSEHAREQAQPRKRRRRTVAGVAAVVLAGSGTAAALVWLAQPDQPQAGIVCRAAAVHDADAIVIEPSKDPVDQCRNLWNNDGFVEFGITEKPQELTACVGTGGAIEVYPGTESVCSELGLALSKLDLSPDKLRLVALQDQLVAEINSVDCVGVDDAAAIAGRIIDNLRMSDWSVHIAATDPQAPCAKAAVITEEKQVVINEF
ncbi:MAG: hypothetical protein R2735_16075 [Microthrixaceae bacterium]